MLLANWLKVQIASATEHQVEHLRFRSRLLRARQRAQQGAPWRDRAALLCNVCLGVSGAVALLQASAITDRNTELHCCCCDIAQRNG